VPGSFLTRRKAIRARSSSIEFGDKERASTKVVPLIVVVADERPMWREGSDSIKLSLAKRDASWSAIVRLLVRPVPACMDNQNSTSQSWNGPPPACSRRRERAQDDERVACRLRAPTSQAVFHFIPRRARGRAQRQRAPTCETRPRAGSAAVQSISDVTAGMAAALR
jgi:hypothetical protein